MYGIVTFREWMKKKRELKKHQREAIKAFERYSRREVSATGVTSLEMSDSISYALNRKQFESALKSGNYGEAAAALMDIGELAQRNPEIAKDYQEKETPAQRAIIRKEILRYSLPSFMRHPLKKAREALHTIKMGAAAYALGVVKFMFSMTSIPSWARAHKEAQSAYALPSEENIRRAGLHNIIAVFDTLTLAVLGYFVYDFARDLNHDIFMLKTAGLLTVKAIVHKAALALAAKTFAVVSLDAFKASEQRRFEGQLVALRNIEIMVTALGVRDEYTRGHVERVCEYSEWIARELGLSEREVLMVRHSAKLHDLGKLGIRDGVLLKEGRLTDDEFEEIKKHPLIGYAIASHTTDIDAILLGILQHHEKLDGSGYYGAKGDEIHMSARILAVADIFDAIATDRPYQKGRPVDVAFDILRKEGEKGKLDAGVVEAFITAYSRINGAK